MRQLYLISEVYNTNPLLRPMVSASHHFASELHSVSHLLKIVGERLNSKLYFLKGLIKGNSQ
jgi:hypothetical protein